MNRMTEGRSPVLTQLLAVWFAVVQMETHSPGQTNLRAGSGERSPQVAVSPSVLDFGLTGVGGRKANKDLTLTVSNAGGGILNGTATAASPFSVIDGAYSLRTGQSKSLKVRYEPSAPGTNTGSIILSGGTVTRVLVTGWARMAPVPPGKPRVVTKRVTEVEAEQCDFIVHYYSDDICYMLKPPRTMKVGTAERDFYSICTRTEVLKLAKALPGRDQAIVAVGYLLEETVKLAWANDLKSLGYKNIIFCRGDGKPGRIIGQEVLNGPQATKLSSTD